MPWLRSVEDRFKDQGLVMVGVHTPEFFYEKSVRAVKKACEDLHLHSPQMIDREGDYWTAAGNRAWPSIYLVGKDGRLLARYTGTVLPGEHNALAIEAAVAEALER